MSRLYDFLKELYKIKRELQRISLQQYNLSFFFLIKEKKIQDIYHLGTSSGSAHVNVSSSNTLPSPQVFSRGQPLTQVIKRSQSFGTANLGQGQNLAAAECGSTFSGHLNPTTSATKLLKIFKNEQERLFFLRKAVLT